MRVITIANEKGGIGKTTTTVNLAAALGISGCRVLVIDLDSQTHASQWLGVGADDVTPERSSYGILTGQTTLVNAIVETEEQNIIVCPAHRLLVKVASELGQNVDGIFMLRDALETAMQAGLNVEYVLIDCPGAVGPVVNNALVAADLVIAPVQAELLSVEGLGELTSTVQRVKQRHSPHLPPPVVLINNYEGRSSMDRQILEALRQQFGRNMFATVIGREAPLREAFGDQHSIFRYRRTARSATLYRELANEVLERVHD